METETGNERDDSEDCPTVEEVHATMKQFHLRKRQYQQDDAARRAKSARIKRKNRSAAIMKHLQCFSMHFDFASCSNKIHLNFPSFILYAQNFARAVP